MSCETSRSLQSIEWTGAPGLEEEERIKGAVSYLSVLERLHRELQPVHYFEIGVRHGASLALAQGAATGVDPAPVVDRALPSSTRVVSLTSDAFFERPPEWRPPDLCFIDGMHLFEYALRDLINVEQCCAPGAVVVLDDIFPNHPAQAERERRTRVWTGDVWRLTEALLQLRPDLFVMTLDASPAGLLLVAGLDRESRVLQDNYTDLVREGSARSGPPDAVLERRDAVDPCGERFSRTLAALKRLRANGTSPRETARRLRDP